MSKFIVFLFYGFTCILMLVVSEDVHFVPLSREFISLLEDEKRYNRYATPTQYDGVPTNVSMSMYIEGISSFSAQTMDYHLDMYFQQEWEDKRLKHNSSSPILIKDKSIFLKMWHPDLYFANARQASFQDVTDDNFLVWVYPSGNVWYDCRISLIVICTMDLWKYPLDSQICEMHAYPESVLRLRWSERIQPSIDFNTDIKMPDMQLLDIKTGACNGTYSTGVWSCMTAVFFVERQMLHHVVQTYVPTALIVVISWFNFWLDIDSAPARVSLSITTLLTIATQANAVKLSLPEVSYMKAIDVWMGACLAFVFGVMIEFTVCHFAKNQDMESTSEIPNLIVDSTLSTLFGGGFNHDKPSENSSEEDLNKQIMNHKNSTISQTRVHNDNEVVNFLIARLSQLMIDLNYFLRQDPKTRNSSIVKRQLPKPEFYSVEEDMEKQIMNHTDNATDVRLRIPPDMNPDLASFIICAEQLKKQDPKIKNASKLKKQVTKRALGLTKAFSSLRGREVALRIDEKSRFVFPLSFIIFNIVYWTFYLVLN